MRSRLAGHTMRYLCCTIAALLLAALWSRADAAVVVQIDRASQRMAVSVDGVPRYNWRVSTARRGYITPPGTYEISHLGRPASHGCVRLDPQNAAILFGLGQRDGMAATTIVIH